MPLAISDYALIGDLQTGALVGKDGSIDWCCLPNFSSGACFAALLGSPDNGRWLLAPAARPRKIRRAYRDRTLILETTYTTATGSVRVTDFMPVRGTHPDIVRVVHGIRGHVAMRSELVLRFDYGRSIPWVTALPAGLRAISGPDMVIFRTPAKMRGEDFKTISEFTVHAGQTVPFVLTYGPSTKPLPRKISWQSALRNTDTFWRDWIAQARYSGPYKDAVLRSLITLKALTYRPSGGIVAALTTSLPEKLRGQRNWDYRYCWLRDTTFTLLALMNAGFADEARAWRDWLLRAIAGSPDQVQIMYGLSGERRLIEYEIDWLAGYQGAKPVRIGNQASTQVQLDIYGEIMDALFHSLSIKDGHRTRRSQHVAGMQLQAQLIQHLEKVWRKPDQGIWEMRSKPKHYTYSKVMAWVAFDRVIRIAEQQKLDRPIARWKRIAAEIHAEVCDRAFNKKLNSFAQSYESKHLDASLLLLPLVGFLPPSDPRIQGTVAAIEKHLSRGGFILRYNTEKVDDSLPPGEGVFLACSFWMVANLKLQNRTREAHKLFNRLLKLRSNLGLLSEEYDPRSKRLVGNYPQAFSHISLLNAAYHLSAQGRGELGPHIARHTRTPK
jgi:GH15 family glucan-1,4-alpha-glucosidase